MKYRIAVDICNKNKISGWAINYSNPSESLALDLMVNDKFHATIFARNHRSDLVKAGIGNGQHGFIYKFSNLVKKKYNPKAKVKLILLATQETVYTNDINF